MQKKVRPISQALVDSAKLNAQGSGFSAYCNQESARVEDLEIDLLHNKRVRNLVEFDEESSSIFFDEGSPTFCDLSLSVDIGVEEVDSECAIKILNQIVAIARDPLLVAKYLKPLEDQLKCELGQEGVELEDNRGEYLIAGKCGFIAGYKDCQFFKKGKILDRILHEKEVLGGMKSEAVTFVGVVAHEAANNFLIKNLSFFKEDEQISRMLLHGKYSHRLIFEVVRQAALGNAIDLTINDCGKKIDVAQLFKLLIAVDIVVKGKKKMSFWEAAIDSVFDASIACEGDVEKYYDPKYYCYSSTSPFNFRSLLTCFGQDLGLPTLQRYLLDSHYKQAAQMVERLKGSAVFQKYCEKNGKVAADFSNEFLYDYCMMRMSIGNFPSKIGDISGDFIFTDRKDVRANRYEEIENGIARKVVVESAALKGAGGVRYENLEEYLAAKKAVEGQRKK